MPPQTDQPTHAVRKVADVVFGSRFYGRPHRSLYFHHYLGNRLISLLFNLLFNQTLITDIECCYKMMTSRVAQSLRLTADDFGIEVEISAEIARRNLRIYEVGISYFGRSYAEGKKAYWKDGLRALWYVFKFRLRPWHNNFSTAPVCRGSDHRPVRNSLWRDDTSRNRL